MNMCTVREIREAIQEDCRSQRDMESTEIDRVFQTLPTQEKRYRQTLTAATILL